MRLARAYLDRLNPEEEYVEAAVEGEANKVKWEEVKVEPNYADKVNNNNDFFCLDYCQYIKATDRDIEKGLLVIWSPFAPEVFNDLGPEGDRPSNKVDPTNYCAGKKVTSIHFCWSKLVISQVLLSSHKLF